MLRDKYKGILTYFLIIAIILFVIFTSKYYISKLCSEQFKIFISSVQDYLTSIAILIGGSWAILKLILLRQNAWGINIETNLTSIHKADNKYNWIILNVHLRNMGKRRIYLGKLYYSCYEIQENKQNILFENEDDWLSILKYPEKEPDLYMEPNESLNRVLYSLVNKESLNLIFKIFFEDDPYKSPYQLIKIKGHIWGSYMFVKNVIKKS